MNIKERILAAMSWEEPDIVPLTVYEMLFPRSEKERLLRESGGGMVLRPPAHQVEHRQVELLTREYWQRGRKLTRRTIRTPVGEVWQTLEQENEYATSSWIREHFIKGVDDYRVMEFYYQDMVFHDNYEFLNEANRRIGGDGLVYVRIAKSPIQEMLYQMMGYERFSIDYYEHRDLFDSLNNTMLKRYGELFDLAAAAPVEILLMADNITADVVGSERFRNYCVPVYEMLRNHIRGTDKKFAVHMDGRLASLKEEIGETEFHIVEGFTPPPVGDVSVREARESWPEKALWINFTSSIHVDTPERIEAHTRQLLQEAGGKRGFAVGVTEDVPLEAMERSLDVISRVLREYA